VAAAYTWPLELTARPEFVSEERKSVEVKVDEALERSPLVNPIVVEVALPYPVDVNGNAVPPVPHVVVITLPEESMVRH